MLSVPTISVGWVEAELNKHPYRRANPAEETQDRIDEYFHLKEPS
jgi:hypothetical protein